MTCIPRFGGLETEEKKSRPSRYIPSYQYLPRRHLFLVPIQTVTCGVVCACNSCDDPKSVLRKGRDSFATSRISINRRRLRRPYEVNRSRSTPTHRYFQSTAWFTLLETRSSNSNTMRRWLSARCFQYESGSSQGNAESVFEASGHSVRWSKMMHWISRGRSDGIGFVDRIAGLLS